VIRSYAEGVTARDDATTKAAAARRRNPRGAGENLRAEILDAVRGMLIENGYDSVLTLRGVARRVGIAAQSIYPHFAGPEEMVAALTVETFAELGRAIATATADITDPRVRLLAGCRAYIAFGLENPELYGLLFRRNRLLRGEEARPESGTDDRDVDSGPFAALLDGVRRCIEAGESTSESDVLTATQLWAAMHGLVMLRGNDYQFPWPDPEQLEIGLITSVARLRERDAVPT
jgi:AcrR family transcriptional regulator